MSTKVYVAYRLKRQADFWPLVRDVKRVGARNVKRVVAKFYAALREQVDATSTEYADALSRNEGDDWMARHSIARRMMLDGYRSQLGSSLRNEFNLDVSVGVWEHAGSMYMIPYCDMLLRGVLGFMKRDARLASFAYWNNTDRPRGVSAREWAARGRVWNAIDAAGWQNSIAIDVCSWGGWFAIDPWLDEMRKHRRAAK